MAKSNRLPAPTETANFAQLAHQPTPVEKQAIDAWAKSTRDNLDIRFKVEGSTISPDHDDPELTGFLLLFSALGNSDSDFASGLTRQIANAVDCSGSQPSAEEMNFVLSVIKSIEPRDQLEAMLATQMAMVQMAAMKMARKLTHADLIPQQDSAERALNKLTRTFTTQMEALKRYRKTGEQKIKVEHVTVNEGGQAIVGDCKVTHNRGSAEKSEQ